MKGITCCGDCIYYNWKKKCCNRGAHIETDPRSHFWDDCPLPDVVPEPRWIPVIYPPTEDGIYLVYATDGNQYVESYGDLFDSGKCEWTRRNVAFWRHLPKGPKEEA